MTSQRPVATLAQFVYFILGQCRSFGVFVDSKIASQVTVVQNNLCDFILDSILSSSQYDGRRINQISALENRSGAAYPSLHI